ncbi:hypothetical protein V6R21_28890 [Limibacter armeniacum]|uniref:hypothetical protein n=1 Tax=Limibacter armeniacum TaxID=466084 RepID=UPI002FE60B36
MKRFFSLIIGIALCGYSYGQSDLVPYNKDYYNLLDRYEIKQKTFSQSFHSISKPYSRADIATFIEQYQEAGHTLSMADKFNLDYLKADNWQWISDSTVADAEKPFLTYFYKKKTDLYHVKTKNLVLRANPVLYTMIGSDKESDSFTFYNTRGVTVQGSLDNKIGFYFYAADNLMRFPAYVERDIQKQGAIAGEGRWLPSGDGNDQREYFTGRGYITFAVSESINAQFGYDKNFIGDGYRSMILSDNSNDYLFLKLNTKVWKLNYTNIFAQMMADNDKGDGQVLPKKYLAFHHLSANILKNLNIGFYESVMYAREGGGIELAYMNPIMFYRSLEHDLGDGDSVILGADLKWNIFNCLQLYGQLAIDDIQFKELFKGSGWYANKFAIQMGGKYIDAFKVSNLDLQGEINIVKPYMYSHFQNIQNSSSIAGGYHHYQQPLAHPLGANLKEFIGMVRYQPSSLPKFNFRLKGIYVEQGLSTETENWGDDIFRDYTTRVQEYGNKTGQGVASKTLMAEANVSYQFFHNFFVDLQYIYRKQSIEEMATPYNTSYTNLAIRWNVGQKLNEF